MNVYCSKSTARKSISHQQHSYRIIRSTVAELATIIKFFKNYRKNCAINYLRTALRLDCKFLNKDISGCCMINIYVK